MFTTNLKSHDSEYTKVVIQHVKELKNFGYTGFEFPMAQGSLKITYKKLRITPTCVVLWQDGNLRDIDPQAPESSRDYGLTVQSSLGRRKHLQECSS